MIIDKIKIDSNEMGYLRFGDGSKPLVIIPGLSLRSVLLSSEAIKDAYNELCEEYTVYVFDRPNKLEKECSLEWIADLTVKAMSALGIENAYLMGASQGGMICQYIAANHPELIKKLVLSSTTCRINKAASAVFRRWIEMARAHNVQELNHDFLQTVFSKEYLDKYKDVLPEIEKLGTEAECDRMVVMTSIMVDKDFTDVANMIKCPTLVIGSTLDRVFDQESIRWLADNIGAGLYMYNEYGHACYDEAVDFKRRIIDFCGERK